MYDPESIKPTQKHGAITPLPNQLGNTSDAQAAIDLLPDPKNPLEIDAAGCDGLDRIFRCVAVSANTVRDAGYPQTAAWHLVLAARHVKRAMDGIEKANAEGDVMEHQESRRRWGTSTMEIRCFDKTRKGGSVAKVS